jgi:3-oxoacyl-[acyl-carrier protein] reductase
MSFAGKTALVTGAYRGIGLAIATKLARLGAKVAAVDINEECVESLKKYFQEQGLEGMGVVMDVTKQDSIDKAIEKINESYGVVQILVNNAGITRDNLLLRMSQNEWDQVIDANLNSVYKVTRACIRGMLKERWGRIVNIASVVGLIGNPGQANYCASKAGVLGFTKALAREIASRNITVNAIAPGFIETIMTQKLSTEQRNQILSTIPMGKIGTPEDIAEAVAFFASDSASYITGETLQVNGGMYIG